MAKKKKAAPRMSKLGALVFAETAFHTGAGMQKAMGNRDYALNDEAREYWLGKHARSIPIALKRATSNWEEDRKVVNPQAEKLGKFAAEYALADAGPSGVVEVKRNHVEKASKKVNESRQCRKASARPGGGGYCEG